MKHLMISPLFFIALPLVALSQSTERPRLRDLGVELGIFRTGKFNAITDVEGVTVGQVTLNQGDNIRTGVTAILPHSGNLFQEKVPAAMFIGNGFGKLVGFTQVEELGQIETPILLTNTLSVWDVANGVVDYMLGLSGNENVRSVNPIVGETNDGALNDIRGRYVKREHAIEAIQKAQSGVVEEGCVGAGTGTICFGWKGGIGTSSRVLPPTSTLGGFTVGALVQTNFGGVLDIAGVPVGKELGKYAFKEQLKYYGDGSCMMVIATDAPLNSAQLKRLAKRATLALGRTGSSMSHGSGDYVIAFSTAKAMRINMNAERLEQSVRLREDDLSPFFQAVVEATEEAIYNSLLKATTTKGVQGHEIDALPIEKVKEVLKKYGRIKM
ncbi:MAG: P1 family peptidase [Ignavibacteriales bacterium]|nr:P1 family peptidase [Ignavibacteriales bacterium]